MSFSARIIAAAAVATFSSFAMAQFDQPRSNNNVDPFTGERQTVLLDVTPSLYLPIQEHDFGRILGNQTVSFEFPFENTGSGSLEILNIKGTCGCTIPELTKKTYAPGETGTIKVSYNPKSKTGNQHTRVNINTNDTANPLQVVHIRVHVDPLVIMEPKSISFRQVAKNQTHTADLKITGRTEDFEATMVTPSHPDALSAEILGTEQVEIDGLILRQTTIRITLSEDIKIGQLNGSLNIRTNDPRSPMLTIRAVADVLGDLNLSPSRFAVGMLKPGATFERDITLSSRSGEPFNIIGIKVIPSNDLVEYADAKPIAVDGSSNNAYTIRLSGKGIEKNGLIRGEIEITTDVRNEETLKVLFYGTMRPR